MIIFYDPETNNQIKAFYTDNTTSTVWTDLGYVRLEVADPGLVALIESRGQDLRAVVIGGVLDDVESWPRPALEASVNPMPADGVAECVITATFADPGYAEDVEFVVGEGAPMVVGVVGGVAELTFGPVEVAGVFDVWCISPTYGKRRIEVGVTDA